MPNADKWVNAIKKQSKALEGIAYAYRHADSQIKNLKRNGNLYKEERETRIREVHQELEGTLRKLQQGFTAAQKEAQEVVKGAEDLSNDTIQRRMYFRQMAQDELAGADPITALNIARQAAQSGDSDKAMMYLSAARPLVKGEGQTELSRLRRQAEPVEVRQARHLSAVNQQLAERISLSVGMHEPRMKQMLGVVDPEVQAGRKSEPGLDIQGMTLLSSNLESMAAELLNKTVAHEKRNDPTPPSEVAHQDGAFDSRTVRTGGDNE